MKVPKYHFSHPVKGIIRLLHRTNPRQSRVFPLDTYPGHTASIPVEELPQGKWKAIIEWETDGKDYYYEDYFEIKINAAKKDLNF